MPCEPRPRPRFRGVVLVLAAVLALAAVAACGSSGGSSSSGDITMKDLKFTVAAPVKTGATVTVKNNDDVEHTVTADDGKSFNVTVEAGKTATFTAPSTAGDYKFHCNIHSTMKGTLTVK
jgi:plastocyanin